MGNKTFDYMAKWSRVYSNRLREFYENHERLSLLEYVIVYALLETNYLGKKDDEELFKDRACTKCYKTLKTLYEACVKQLNNDQPMPKIIIPTKEQVLEDIQKKYSGLEKKVNEEEDDSSKGKTD